MANTPKYFTACATRAINEAVGFVGTPTVNSTTKNSGDASYALDSGDELQFDYDATDTYSAFIAVVRFSDLTGWTSASSFLVASDASDANQQWKLEVNTSGQIVVKNAAGTTVATSTGSPFSVDTWHTVHVLWERHDTTGKLRVNVDEVEAVAYTSGTDFLGASTIIRAIGPDQGTCYFDVLAYYSTPSFDPGDLPKTLKKSGPYTGYGSPTTSGDTPDTGVWTDAGEFPPAGANFLIYSTQPSAGGVDTDGSTRSGPSGDTDLTGAGIMAAKAFLWARRSNGSATTLTWYWGDSGDTWPTGMLSADISSGLSTTAAWFDVMIVGPHVPTSSQYFRGGVGKSTGNRSFIVFEQIFSILYEPPPTLSPGSIGSAEAFGTAEVTVAGGETLEPTAIASLEAFGAATVTPGAVTASPSAIGSAEAFGSAQLDLNIINAGDISTGEAFGTQVITPGAVPVAPSAIASLEAFGNPTATPGAVTLSPSSIASAEAFGVALIVSKIIAQAIASAEAFGSATTSPGPVTLTPAAIASLEAFGAASLTPGPVTLSPGAITSLEAFGVAVLTLGPISVSPTAIASLEAFGVAVLTPGPVTVSPSAVASAEAFGSATLTSGVIVLTPSAIASIEAFGSSTLTPGVVILTPSAIASAEAFGTPVLSQGLVVLSPSAIASLETFGTVTVTPGAATVSPSAIASLETFGVALVAEARTLSPGAIASLEAFGALEVTRGAVTLSPSAISSLEAFGTAALTPGLVTLSPSAIASLEAFGVAVVRLAYETPTHRIIKVIGSDQFLEVSQDSKTLTVAQDTKTITVKH